jgi:MFS family permease
MLQKLGFKAQAIIRSNFSAVFILLFYSTTWYFMTLMLINHLVGLPELLSFRAVVFITYNGSVIVSSLIGSILSNKIRRIYFLFSWMLAGAVVSFFPTLLFVNTWIYALIFSFLLGSSFGLGLPSSLSFFADYTVIDNRGLLSGVILLISNAVAILIAIVAGQLELKILSIVTGLWRVLGLVFFVFLKPHEKDACTIKQNTLSFVTILQNKPFLFYLLPSLMFGLVNALEEPIVRNLFETTAYNFAILMTTMAGGIFAFVGGVLADRAGRKRIVTTGFVALGLAYAILGMAPYERISQYFYGAVDGIAGGIFLVMFFFVLWGDLSPKGLREKYYAIGILFYYLTGIIRQIFGPYVVLIQPTAAFSIAGFFLFLAVLPLMYAPETLPERKIRLRQLRSYVEAAKKVREKYLKKAKRG